MPLPHVVYDDALFRAFCKAEVFKGDLQAALESGRVEREHERADITIRIQERLADMQEYLTEFHMLRRGIERDFLYGSKQLEA